jgi:hypothetical protein
MTPDVPTPDPHRPGPPADAAPDADLIAYLDGELDGEEARDVEAQLALDPEVRDKAEAYKKTFDLLDYLPKPEPSPDFATRTLTRLQPVAGAPAATAVYVPALSGTASAVPPRSGWFGGLVWLAAALVALVGGYAAHAALRPYLNPPARFDLDDVRVVENLPLYVGVDDLEFVRSLDTPGLFAPDPSPTARAETPRPETPPATREKLITLFKSYPPARQQQLRELDQQLRDLPTAERDHLFRVLERYSVWLDRLPDPDRKEVLAAPPTTRLDVIRRVKERAWRDGLPAHAKQLLALAAADDQQQLRLVEGWKNAEQTRREEWNLARRQWDALGPGRKPWPFNDDALTRQVDEYIRTVLKVDPAKDSPRRAADLPAHARVSFEEFRELKDRYEAAHTDTNGGWNWFLYGLFVYRMAERHPYLPEPGAGTPITEIKQLPPGLLKNLRQKKQLPPLGRWSVVGKWPEFAREIGQAARRANVTLPQPLGPCKPGEFTPTVNDFLRETLTPKLTSREKEALKRNAGKWPEYPEAMVRFARRHDLPVPGVTLPGRPSLWEKYYSFTPVRLRRE